MTHGTQQTTNDTHSTITISHLLPLAQVSYIISKNIILKGCTSFAEFLCNFCLVFGMVSRASVYGCSVVSCWERQGDNLRHNIDLVNT